jgi:hypothetical protein
MGVLTAGLDADIDAFIAANAASAYHPCGTCKMGPAAAVGDGAVVDPTSLAVHNTEGRCPHFNYFKDMEGGYPRVGVANNFVLKFRTKPNVRDFKEGFVGFFSPVFGLPIRFFHLISH